MALLFRTGGSHHTGTAALPHRNIQGITKKRLFFREWWNKIVFVDNKKRNFTRRDLVLIVANKDGGSHVDAKLPKKYIDLIKNNSLGWEYSVNNQQPKPIETNAAYVAIRQIAYEIVQSLSYTYDKYKLESTQNFN